MHRQISEGCLWVFDTYPPSSYLAEFTQRSTHRGDDDGPHETIATNEMKRPNLDDVGTFRWTTL
jgi:hypothetical protein